MSPQRMGARWATDDWATSIESSARESKRPIMNGEVVTDDGFGPSNVLIV